MKILLTGATGYIARRLLPVLLDARHQVICCVRDADRFNTEGYPQELIRVIEVDLLDPDSLEKIPKDIDAAYYLVHSMSSASGDFSSMEARSAENFKAAIDQTQTRQVIYLSGIANEKKLSKHLKSRRQVEAILNTGKIPLTTLRAGIIIGSGSASFEIIRDLVEKLPVMIAPKWINTRCQPIAIRNVIEFLSGVLGKTETYGNNYDIGGSQILTYKEMLSEFAEVRHLKRKIIVVPFMTPRLSSYWLYFVTSTSYPLAKNLVDSMKVEVVCKPNNLTQMLHIELVPYKKSIELAFDKIEQNLVLSSWKDALTSRTLNKGIAQHIEVPVNGCFKDHRSIKLVNAEAALERIWRIGGKTGWYYGNRMWAARGTLDRLVGGVGLRRGRKNPVDLNAGDSLDFWRVLLANKKERRLLLYAEMKLPGEAWLEFKINDDDVLEQTATFRPLGLWGRLYWYLVLPFHAFIFRGMLKNIAEGKDLLG